MNPYIFREFSIRGVADQDLTDDVVVIIGQAVGTFFTQQGGKSLTVGRDVRNSSFRISQSFVAGLLQTDCDVIDLGVLPTPVHNFATDFCGADGGIMITASHNPPQYNGFKIRTHRTLQAEELQKIYRICQELSQKVRIQQEPNDIRKISGAKRISQFDPAPVYLERVKSRIHTQQLLFDKRPLRVVVDGGNGTNGLIVSQLLRDLGCDVIEVYCTPDGNFPNRAPDPTEPGAVNDLATSVLSEKADLGVAYDGDGDRVVLVDEQGNVVLGDQVLMLLARDVLIRRGPAKIVYEILCTQALADDIVAHGGTPIKTPSGYAYIHETMLDTGAALGGELSGHLFFDEPDFGFDDAILATVKLLDIVTQRRQPLSALVAELPAYYSSPELRVKCPDELKARVVETVKAEFGGKYKIETLDGVRIHFNDGWALVRQSNTQPVISMRFEARSPEQLEEIQTKVQSFVEVQINQP